MTAIVRAMVDIVQPCRLPAVDLADMRAVLGESGRAGFGTGEAGGPDRAMQALARAVEDLERDGAPPPPPSSPPPVQASD